MKENSQTLEELFDSYNLDPMFYRTNPYEAIKYIAMIRIRNMPIENLSGFFKFTIVNKLPENFIIPIIYELRRRGYTDKAILDFYIACINGDNI